MRRIAVGLHDDPLHASAIGKVVDVAEPRLVEMVLLISSKVTPKRAGLLAVDDQIDLRRRRQSFDIDVLKHGALLGGGEQLVRGAHQLRIAPLAAILQAETEAAGIAEIVDRRRLQRRDFAVTNRGEVRLISATIASAAVSLDPPLRPVLQRDEGLRGILP